MKTGMGIRHENFRMVGKLAVVTLGMFAFGDEPIGIPEGAFAKCR